MFLRLVRANVSKGVKREYVRVVEAYRDHAPQDGASDGDPLRYPHRFCCAPTR